MSANQPVLPQGAGYGVDSVIGDLTDVDDLGIGLFFSVFMVGMTSLQTRYTGFNPRNSEEFNSASRSVKPGLIASGIVSAWTWAATLLAAKLKMNAPYAHTWLEIIAARWGTVAHLVFLFFGLATNVIVSSMLILGGAATVTSLTGMSTIAACFLIPLGVAVYVVVGGMRATLLCDYTHTSVLFVIIFVFVFTVYTTSDKIGSPAAMHALLTKAAETNPVSGNAHGSYITMRSKNGLIFGVINVIGNFAAVFQDQAYWQRAIASRPASCVKAFLLGGLAWFAIPFMFATTLGLSAVALRGDPAMRTLSPEDVSAGLPASAAAAALLGEAGAVCVLIVIFLAITSATSAELIAVSSILTYDVYQKYFNPQATEAEILTISHATVALFASVMAILGLIFFYIGISMGWLYEFMGVVLGSAVVPIALCVSWRKANKWGCIAGAVIGFCSGIIAWLVTTSSLNDSKINVTTSGGDFEMLAGNLASIGVGGIVTVVTSLIWPDNFDFNITREINAPDPTPPGSRASDRTTSEDRKSPVFVYVVERQHDMLDPVALRKAYAFAKWSSVALTIVLVLAIPLPLFFARTVYGVDGLKAWVAVGIVWTFFSAFTVVIYPLYESRTTLLAIFRGMVKDVFANGTGEYLVPEPDPYTT
ncbi:hypothetical protein NLI96_g3181 [Meripilus lineatus]|uniref:Urea transporter n=1 Tax=Meripilus lineatus TaxID=2056292 RepID=A0AAD5YGU7_9APHY|nr:hypothetical protein NLI96_g3181 [Physisporinus lineatus]